MKMIKMELVAIRLCDFDRIEHRVVFAVDSSSSVNSHTLTDSTAIKESMTVRVVDYAAVSTIQFCLSRATFHAALPAGVDLLVERTQNRQIQQSMLLMALDNWSLNDRRRIPSGCCGGSR